MSPRSFIVLLLFSLAFSDPIVDLPKGRIKGKTILTVNNKTVHAFLGIPFAKPPLGPLRFQPPEEPDRWDEIRDTSNELNIICFTTKDDSDKETEDCLYLNVVTPALNLNTTVKQLPVLFSIYGGAFRAGSASYGHGPDYFLEKDIVYVNFNYRLGPFGFISTGDLILPGNMGLKDQHLALKWTYENIHLFGGDKNQITIHGQSAGAASVTYQILHKKSKGMFRAAIAESGSALSLWAHIEQPKDYAVNLLTTMNNGVPLADNSSKFIQHYLLNATAREIDKASAKVGTLTLPTMEPEHDGAFISQSMYTLLESGDFSRVPLIIGINSEESIYRANDLNTFKKTADQYSENPLLLVPTSLGNLSSENKSAAAKAINDLYVGEGNTFTDHLGPLVGFFSDTSFTRPGIRFAELYSQYAPVWFYQFSYKGPMGHQHDTILPGAERVAHSENVHYYLVSGGTYPEQDVITSSRLVNLWSNFIKNGNPTPTNNLLNITWPMVETNKFRYLDINTTLEVRTNPKSPRFEQWKRLFDIYGIKPFATY